MGLPTEQPNGAGREKDSLIHGQLQCAYQAEVIQCKICDAATQHFLDATVIESIQNTKSKAIVVRWSSKEQKSRRASTKRITNIPIFARIPSVWTEGVVKGVDLDHDLPPSDIVLIMDNQKITGKVMNINRLYNKNGEKSKSVKIRFNTETLPNEEHEEHEVPGCSGS